MKDELKDIYIIEFGSGDCTKISLIVNAIPEIQRNSISYVPFDVSETAIRKSCNNLLRRFPRLSIHGIVADFMTQLDVLPAKSKKIICFLGSTIGNFSKKQSIRFLQDLEDIMHSGDRLLLGFDMVKDKEIIENAYNDSQKVTEKFNKNILHVVNDLIDTNFNPDDFAHVAFFNEEMSRIEMHLKAVENVEVFSPRLDAPLFLKKGETIHTENSYKFTIKQIEKLAQESHLDIEKIFTDGKKWFSLAILIKP